MKSIYKVMLSMVVIGMLSCGDITEINVDPNNSPSANDAQVLTSALGYTSWVVDGQYNDLAFLWGQYWTWGPGVSLGDAERYVADAANYNNEWSRAYANALTDLEFLTGSDNPSYRGIAKIMKAYVYQGLVDHWGDVPFSEAISGEIEAGGIVAPTYDSGAAIYASLVEILDEANADLQGADNIGAEDLVYGGDVSKWVKFGNSLKLRVLMRQSITGNVGSAVQATVARGNFIETNDENAEMSFIGTSGDENPMFANEESGIGNFYVASNTALNLMVELNDPRIPAFYDVAPNSGEFVGIDQGAIDNEDFTSVRQDYSQGSAIAYGSGVSTIFMSSWEVYFLRAEAAQRFGTGEDVSETFSNAISANFDFLGVEGAGAYISSLVFTGDDVRLNQIATQKWLSFNGLQEDEGWIESRRFDTPENPLFSETIFMTPLRSALGEGVYPSIYLYPETEITFNPNAPQQRRITDKVFWDN